MILDHLNQSNSVTRHWEANHHAALNGKATLGFVTPATRPLHPKLYYIYFNLVPNHAAYGQGLICYKHYIDDLADKVAQVTTKTTNLYHPTAWESHRPLLHPKTHMKIKITRSMLRLNKHPP